MKNKITSFWIITLILAAAKLTVHLLTYSMYELHRDEMLYFAMGDHLSFGYASTPPFVGFLAFIAKSVFGYSEFGIKLLPALAGVASVVLMALMVREMGGKNMALIIAGTGFIAAAAFLRTNSMFQPVSFDQLFWLLSAYLALRLVNTGNLKLWFWIGAVFGLAFLNKYSIVFFAFALVAAILISKHRKLIFTRQFVIGMFIGFLVILPNVVWQYTHNWPVVHHMAELQRTQLVHVNITGFLIEQLMNCSFSTFIWLVGLVALLFFRAEKQYRFLALAFLLTIFVIVLGHGKAYYTLGAYTMMLAAGGYTMEKYFRKKWAVLNYLTIAIAIVGSIWVLPMELPVASFNKVAKLCDPETGKFPQRWEDGEIHPIPQDYADMTGWKELTEITAKAYNSLDEIQKKTCMIYAENYGLAGAVNFYGHSLGLPKPFSMSDSYLLWAPDSATNGPFIYINNEVGDIDKLFNTFPEVGRVNNPYFRENGVRVFLCTDPKENWKQFYSQKIKEMKSIYN